MIHPLKAVPFNITVDQACAPTPDYDDNETEEFYYQLHNVIDQTPRRDMLILQGDRNGAKLLMKTGMEFADPSAMTTKMREGSDFWSLSPLTILC